MERTFVVLREQRLWHLFNIADGRRLGHSNGAEGCAAVRAIVEQGDWPCEGNRNYTETKLGQKRRVNNGLDWVFGQVEQPSVLENSSDFTSV